MMIANNGDLLTDILLWLPAKYLVRLKLVCKQWLSIITSRRFSHCHILLHRHHISHFVPKPSFLITHSRSFNYFYIQQSEKLVPYHFATLVKPIIRAYSGGLFLVQCDPMNHPLGDCYVYNPTTKESRKISLNTDDNCSGIFGLNFAFDPSKSPHYKIICVRDQMPNSSRRSQWYRCKIEVYESNTGVWKLLEDCFTVRNNIFLSKGIYWNGSIHWRGVFFDFQESRLRYHPEVRNSVYDQYEESNGYLHYIAHFPKEKCITVFELQRDYSEWLLKYCITLDMIHPTLSVLSLIRGESDVLLLHQSGKIVAYRFIDKSIKEIAEGPFYKEPCIKYFRQLSNFQYMDTLAPP